MTVPDCLKQGVLKCHLYDPDLNPGYAQLARDFSTAVVPARPDHPRDKAYASYCTLFGRSRVDYFGLFCSTAAPALLDAHGAHGLV